MDKKKKIVHIITKDKFSVGYINFMKIQMRNYRHCFLLISSENSNYNENDLIDKDDIYYYKNSCSLIVNYQFRNMFSSSDKIIISGLFGSLILIALWPKSYMEKTYIQLWGEDFYCLRMKRKDLLHRVADHFRLEVLKSTQGIIFLIKEEENPFRIITGINPKNSFDAPMMEDPLKENLLFSCHSNYQKNKIPIIIVGNSGYLSNHHSEAFRALYSLNITDYIIKCPLSYGDKKYANKVVDEGKMLFGDKFEPITEWMSKEQYFSFLGKCDVGIFFNDRQQALGNIYALLYMGKKVFIRKNTSMYMNFKNNGCIIFSEDDLDKNNILNELDEECKMHNKEYIERYYSQEYAIKKWERVLNY